MPLILVYRETFVSFAYVVNLWSCWNSGYELDIVTTTRSNRVCQSFSFSLSLSTELLEDKQGFKLGGVWYVSIVSTFPNSFALVLDYNLHDLNGTNPEWRWFQQNLIFESALHLCFAVSERASEIPPIHIASCLFWLKCWYLKLIIIFSLADYAIDISLPWDLCVICLCG